MTLYVIVSDGPCLLSCESSDSELVYTTDPQKALAFSTRKLAEASPWFCVGDAVMELEGFEALMRLSG